jgi:glycosyltransferase involved in cell wall biosynthesis
MPRKNAQDVVQVLNLLRGRGALSGWDLVPIDGVPEAEVAKRLGECAVFLSFGHPEGCPLPPLEAMASGCVVVGYHGRGGREYFDPAYSYPVEVGDVVGFAKAVEEVLEWDQREPGTLERKGKLAAEYVRTNYSPEREAQDIVGIWETIVKARNAAL